MIIEVGSALIMGQLVGNISRDQDHLQPGPQGSQVQGHIAIVTLVAFTMGTNSRA
jgi:hypothetical protein